MDRRATSLILIAALLAACNPPAATQAPTKPRRTPIGLGASPSVPPTTGLASAPPLTDGGGLISDHGSGLISDHGGTLTGKVKAPAGLISNNGGGFVSDAGGALVSNNGGGLVSNSGGAVVSNGAATYRLGAAHGSGANYGLRAVDQRAVAGARVELLDAAGARARDRAGAEVPPATTDAEGRYAFTADLPTRNLVVRVVLPGTAGELRAIAPPDAAARQATDVDLVSTMATGYILDRFVKGQADAQATLDKLTPAVEAETRRATAAALDKGEAPKDLAPTTVVAAVDALRKADGALDAQLEKVRALLVAAGLSNLGAGRLATEVPLRSVDHVATTSDGRMFLAVAQDRRIWTVDAQGRLQVAVGRSPAGADPDLAGKAGPEASIDRPIGMAADGDGLLILEPTRLSRLGPDGTLRVLARGFSRAKAVVPRADGRPLILTSAATKAVKGADGKATIAETAPATVLRVAADGGAPEQVHAFPPEVGQKVGAAARVVAVPGGAIWLGLPAVYKGAPAMVLALDPATYAPSEVARRGTGIVQLAFDDAGRVFTRGAGKPDLQAIVGAGGFAVGDVGGRDFPPIAQAPDGSWIFSFVGKAFRSTAGAPALLAGLAVSPREGRADEIPLGSPIALAIEPDDDLLFYDDDTSWLWRADPAGNARVVAELPLEWPAGDDGEYVWPESLHPAPDGATWIFDAGATDPRVLRLGPDGTLSAPFPAGGDMEQFERFAVLKDGTAVALVGNAGPDGEKVLRFRGPGGEARPDVVIPLLGVPEEWEDEDGTLMVGVEDSEFQLGVGPDGMLYLAGDITLRTWTAAGGVKTVASGDAWEYSGGLWSTGGIAVDADGRIYGIGYGTVEQYDPRTDASKVVAGGDAGADVDEGLSGDLRTPAIDRAGNLVVVDANYRQLKRIPRAKL